MPTIRGRHYHHATDTDKVCSICGNPIKMYWKDATEKNGFSDTVQERKNDVVHYFCIPGAKSLHEINEERRKLYEL